MSQTANFQHIFFSKVKMFEILKIHNRREFLRRWSIKWRFVGQSSIKIDGTERVGGLGSLYCTAQRVGGTWALCVVLHKELGVPGPWVLSIVLQKGLEDLGLYIVLHKKVGEPAIFVALHKGLGVPGLLLYITESWGALGLNCITAQRGWGLQWLVILYCAKACRDRYLGSL